MASELATNGTPIAEALTPAQKLMAKHSADEAHRPTIEDVEDEEDIAHPPPSAGLSEKVAGKQKAEDDVGLPTKQKAKAPLNTQDEEAFPALGAPKARTQASIPSTWGKKPAINGANSPASSIPPSTNGSSRVAAPTSGNRTPPTQQNISLPGKFVDSISLYPSQILPRKEMKQPLQEIVRDLQRKYKAVIKRQEGINGAIKFEATGAFDPVRQALKDLARQISAKLNLKIPIPSSARALVIGRQGQTIQGIEKRTGARLRITKQDDSANPAEDEDDIEVFVLIDGDTIASSLARDEVEKIVNEHTSTVNLRLKDIPAEFYPFLAGPHNSRIANLERGRDIKVHVPQYHTRSEDTLQQSPATFSPQPNYHIQISGGRLAAQEAKTQIEREVENLRQQLAIKPFDTDRCKHQFIVGDRGTSLHDFLQETGCSVVFPPTEGDSETLTILGPAERIDEGYNKVEDLASSIFRETVKIAKPRGNERAHAQNVARYLSQKEAVRELERMHNASIVLPTSAEEAHEWEVLSRDGKNTNRARTDIMGLVSGHPPQRFANVNVDPFYHHHLQQRATKQVRKDYGVYVCFPEEEEEEEESQVLLVYESSSNPLQYELPRTQPSANEVKEFQKALQQAQQHLLDMISGQAEIVSREVEANPKFHDKVQRFVDRQHQSLPQDQIAAQLLFGQPQSRASQRGPTNSFSVRGPSNTVDDLRVKIQAFLDQEEKDEVERGHITTFDYPQKYANFLIGKKGENINKLREEYDVDIQVNDGKVIIKGPQAKADAAKTAILALARKLEDEATYVLRIEPEYHRDLIGAKGGQVNRLQDRYDVRINFPRSAAPANDDADTDAGSVKNHRNQAPHEVIIKGPKRGADEAREELLSLLQYMKENSFTATVSVARDQIPKLIGQGGREMDGLRASTGAQIDIPNREDITSGRVDVKLKGSKKQVEDAKKLLQERVKQFDDTIVRTIDIEKKHHRALIGTGGSNIRSIVLEAGGPDDRREIQRIAKFPKADSEDTTIRLEGSKAMIDKIYSVLEDFVKQRDDQVVETFEVAPEKHRLLIGREGQTRKSLEDKFKITLDIPKQNVTGPDRSMIKVSGLPEAVADAKKNILEMVKEHEGETIQVPRAHHNTISNNGQFFRHLRSEYKVTVDHGGDQPPKRAAAPTPRTRVNGGSVPLITDDPASAADNHSWEVVDADASSGEEGIITWNLRGNPENLARARAQIEKKLAEAQKPKATGYLILPDPTTYGLIIGPGGSKISDIRKKTGTNITVPRAQTQGEAIEIVGGKEGIEKAKDIILELVKNGGNGGGRPG